jgi:hypothetical protein
MSVGEKFLIRRPRNFKGFGSRRLFATTMPIWAIVMCLMVFNGAP